jgi:hypothetical protein
MVIKGTKYYVSVSVGKIWYQKFANKLTRLICKGIQKCYPDCSSVIVSSCDQQLVMVTVHVCIAWYQNINTHPYMSPLNHHIILHSMVLQRHFIETEKSAVVFWGGKLQIGLVQIVHKYKRSIQQNKIVTNDLSDQSLITVVRNHVIVIKHLF